MSADGTFRIGCDIGGTFTDGVVMDEATGEFWITKTPSTPADPSRGFARCLELLLTEAGTGPARVPHAFHGTTVATNAIIERKTAPTGLITNEGFTDVLEIGRQQRPKLYDLQQERPVPLVPGRWRLGVRGRRSAHGEEIVPLDLDGVRAAGERLVGDGVESVAVCFLNSYRDPRHEHEAAAVLKKHFPSLYVSTSAEISPLFREFGRVSTTVVNAAVVPIVDRYLSGVETHLAERGYPARLHVVQSNGGLIPSATAKRHPAHIIESGPAAGVIAAGFVGGLAGYKDLLAFDMGGTTAKVGLVKDGEPQVMPDYEVGATARTGQYETGAGYAVTLPVIDLVEVGAGGGSIAWVDRGGALRVGPQSAGAEPGPACFAIGGDEPTVTDAHLVLGRLNDQRFLGGKMRLEPEPARRALAERVARPLGMGLEAAALGVLEVANSNMLRALRLVSTVRGYDPRDYVLVAFGGAGPLHACRLAGELAIPTVLIPTSPGVTSALGILVTDVRNDYMQTCIEPTDRPNLDCLRQVIEGLERRGRDELAAQDFAGSQVQSVRSVDMRYRGQAYELTVSAPAGGVDAAWVEAVAHRFHLQHETTFGHSAPGTPVEIVSLRVTARGLLPRPAMKEAKPAAGPVEAAMAGRRLVWFAPEGAEPECRIFDRYRLGAGHEFAGPAIVEEMDSTTVVDPGWKAKVDRFGNLILTCAR
jgi:N-methylhydantoinase A